MCLVEDNLKLVHYVCHQIKGMEYDDKYQIGCIGLIKAARLYDSDKATFCTYAVKAIRNEILLSLRRKRHPVISLDAPMTEDTTLLNLLPDATDIEGETVDRSELQDKTSRLMALLSPRYQHILTLHIAGYNNRQIGDILGTSKQYVNQVLLSIRKMAYTINTDYQTGAKTHIKPIKKHRRRDRPDG